MVHAPGRERPPFSGVPHPLDPALVLLVEVEVGQDVLGGLWVPKLGSSSRPLLFVDQATEHVPPAHLSGSYLATLGRLTGQDGARVLRAPGHGAVARDCSAPRRAGALVRGVSCRPRASSPCIRSGRSAPTARRRRWPEEP